jgi:hypothetical protein
MDWTPGVTAFYMDYARVAEDGHLALDALEQHLRTADEASAYANVQAFRIQREPDSPIAQNNYAYIHLLLGRESREVHEAALSAFEKAGHLEPILSTYAFSLIRQKNFQKAMDALNRVETSKDPTTLLMQGLCYRGLNRLENLGTLLDRIDDSKFWREEKQLLEDLRSAYSNRIKNP